MIMERFDESLVLLADELCWPLEDVRYIRQNERVSELRSNLTGETRGILREWLTGDYKVKYPTSVGDLGFDPKSISITFRHPDSDDVGETGLFFHQIYLNPTLLPFTRPINGRVRTTTCH